MTPIEMALENEFRIGVRSCQPEITALKADKAELVQVVHMMHHTFTSETGLVEAIRQQSGIPYPWPHGDPVIATAQALIAKHKEPQP